MTAPTPPKFSPEAKRAALGLIDPPADPQPAPVDVAEGRRLLVNAENACVVPLAEAEELTRWLLTNAPALLSAVEERDAAKVDAIGAAERQVGRYIYTRIERLMDAKLGTPEGGELAYLARIVSDVEEYGSDGEGDSPSPEFAELAALRKALLAAPSLRLAGDNGRCAFGAGRPMEGSNPYRRGTKSHAAFVAAYVLAATPLASLTKEGGE